MQEDAIRRWNPWWSEKDSIDVLVGIERTILSDIQKTIKLVHIKDIIGARRTGKTTVMYQIIKYMLNEGINAKDIIFLNFDDPELNQAQFADTLTSIHKINPNISYLFIDEVQQKLDWERWLRTLYDTKKFKQIFISGSSASLLSRDIGRVLTGRHVTFEVYPFSFKEYLKFLGWKKFNLDFLEYNKNKILHYQNEYLKNGGFPEIINKSDSERKIILTNIYNDILSRDISAKFDVSYDIVRKISYYLLSNITSEFSYRSISNSTNLNIETAEKYMGFLKESFMILILDFFSYKTKVQFKRNKKSYCIDTGLRNAVSFTFSADIGKLAENLVFIELKRRKKEIYYWKNKSGNEVDFLVKEGLKIGELIQVCWNLNDAKTKKREINGLISAIMEFKLKTGIIITEDKEGEEVIEDKKIKIIPLWKWLLLDN